DWNRIVPAMQQAASADANRLLEGLQFGKLPQSDILQEALDWSSDNPETLVNAEQEQLEAESRALDAIIVRESIVLLSPEFLRMKMQATERVTALQFMLAEDQA